MRATSEVIRAGERAGDDVLFSPDEGKSAITSAYRSGRYFWISAPISPNLVSMAASAASAGSFWLAQAARPSNTAASAAARKAFDPLIIAMLPGGFVDCIRLPPIG
jgi:hypothetical protein